MRDEATFRVKSGLAEMLKGGVIMDVVSAEQAKVAEDAGAAAVMALERVPADIRRDAAVAADVGGDSLERHHGRRSRVLGDLRLLGADHIHDHTALEHLGEPALHSERRLVAHAPSLTGAKPV